MAAQSRDVRRSPPVLLLAVFLVVTTGILIAGYIYYRNYRENFKRGVERTLLAIADLKTAELIDWRAERLGDGEVFFGNSTFLDLTRKALDGPAAPEAREQLLAWLRSVEQAYQYDRIFILDAQGVERLSTRDVPGPPAAHLRDQVPDVLRSGRVSFLDFHRDAPDLPIHLAILVPLLAAGDPPRPLGVLVLKIDPRTYLFPYIASWPTPSRTAETLLVRREGGEVVFLNELRFRKGTALALRFPLSEATMPAARAALGREGIMEGRDYRGVPVVAALSKVPGTPWSLVARMDVSEAYAPLQERLLEVALIVGALLLGAAAGVGLAWRQQSAKFYHSRYEMSEALRAVSLRQEALLAAVPDIIMEVNAGKVYTWANPAGLEFFGEDVIGKEAAVFFEGEQDTYESVKPLFSGREDVLYVESWQRRKDGEKRLLAWWCRVLKDERGRVTGALSSARDITEQKRSKEALNASEVRYRRLFEAAKDGILILDADTGTILDVNPFLVEMLGFSHDQFLGHRIWDLGFFADIFDSQEKFLELQRKKYVRYENLPLERSDGRKFDVEFVSNVYTVNGQNVIQCNIRDITDRKRAEASLRESEERFRTLYENSTLGLYQTTPAGRILLANPALIKMLGYSSFEELASRNLRKDGFEPSYPRDEFMRLIEKEGEIRGLESAWQRRDGTVLYVRESARAIRDPEGRIIHFDGTVEDITSRKLAEQELALEQSLLRALLENATDQVYFKDVDSRFLRISRAQASRFGLSDPALAVGKSDFDFFAAEHARQALRDEQEIVRSGRPLVDQEEKETWPDGRMAWVSSTKVPLRDQQGRIFGTFGISRDITERKQAGERLNETLRRLRQAINSTVQVLGMTVDARDPYTSGHQRRTTLLAEAIARELGWPPDRIEGLRMAGQVHDIGKISVPSEILSKPTALTATEYKLIKTHAKKGYEILKSVEFPWPLAEIVHQHHERMDGSGYPRGLKGEDIIMEARILAVADTVEAMASDRPYRPAPGIAAALAEIDEQKGRIYDTSAAESCLRIFREKGFRFPA